VPIVHLTDGLMPPARIVVPPGTFEETGAEVFAGGAAFLFDHDLRGAPVALGGGCDELFDGAACFAGADEVGDVEDAGLVV
jgi:hypothetical protein